MRILHVTETHEPAAGGVPTVVDQLVRYLSQAGQAVGLLSVGRDPMAVPPDVVWRNLPARGFAHAWGASPGLKRAVAALLDEFKPDVVHLHGAWMAAQLFTAQAAWKRRIPFLVSFHGMLEPWHWNERGVAQLIKKVAYWNTMARPMFSRAACVHAITSMEREHLRALLPRMDFTVIPNAVDMTEIDGMLAAMEPASAGAPSRRIGFIGRIHPKKGVLLLIQAFERLRPPSPWELWIAGPPNDTAYYRDVVAAVDRSPMAQRIRLVGPLFGADKWAFLRDQWVTVVPSYSEVVGVVNLESAACGTPTITTPQTGLSDWGDGGGLLVEPQADQLAQALATTIGWEVDERVMRGSRSREYVDTHHSLSVVGQAWLREYGKLACRAAA